MGLQLNGPNELVDGYKEFYGPNNRQMPLLIAAGRTPLSAAGLMERRGEVLELLLSAARGIKYERFSDLAKNPKTAPFYELLTVWFDNYFDTSDGAARHSNGRMKVAPDAPYLRLLTPETRLVNGAVNLSEGYTTLAGEEFSKADVNKYCGMPLNRSNAKKNPIWLALARGDKALLDEFVNATFAQAKERFGYDGKMMGVYAPPVPTEGAAGRLWFVYRLYDDISYSRADGYDHLDLSNGRLVG